MAQTLLLFITTLCLALTAQADPPQCSVECPVVGNHKLGYVPGRTYIYKQEGKSSLRFEKVQGGQTDMQWSSTVELSVLTPCDVAITIKEYHMEGKDSSSVPELAEVSERPLIMAISDGKVQHVCVDPEDNTWAVNAKMSVASYLQNTLPSFSEINSESIITERDIQGKCSTNYTLTPTSETNVHVVKEKDNKRCEDRFYQMSETRNNLPWLNMPLPLEESTSTCTQVIEKGIYTSIECTDVNVLKPMYGVYKHITARQMATLQLQPEVKDGSAVLNFSSNSLIKKDLKFDYNTSKKNENVKLKLEDLLRNIATKVEEDVEPEAASLVHQVVFLLRYLPDSQFTTIYENIRKGEYGQNKEKLELIYLDAITFAGESGAVPIWVDKIMKREDSEVRTALYAVAMHLLPRPNTFAIESLTPLFEMPQPPSKIVLLAAASMVSTYIRQNPWNQEEKHVQDIIGLITSKLESLHNPDTSEKRDHAKLLLKALSNIGYLPIKDVSIVESLLLEKNADTSIRVEAAQTLGHLPCKLLDHRKLLQNYKDTEESTEIRVASYLSFIRCVTSMTELDQIVQDVITETNIQVRSLVITHLTNLQETSSPHKEHLRYLLSTAVLPNDYVADIRKFSRNTELSYFLHALGLGAEIDSNLVFSREAVLPRSVNMNVTLDLLGNVLNVAEVGARLEGFNSLVERVFGLKSHLISTLLDQDLRDINPFDEEGRSKIVDIVKKMFSETRRGSPTSGINRFLEDKVRSRQEKKTLPEVDLYLRLFGKEVSFASQTYDFSFASLPSDLMTPIKEMVRSYFGDSHLNTTRALPFNLEYSIPTMQGIPLDLYLCGAAVLGLNASSKIDFPTQKSMTRVKVPSLSLEVDGFVGFRSVVRHGVKVKNNLHISNGGRVELDMQKENRVKIQWIPLPQKRDLISFKSQTFLIKEWSPVLENKPKEVSSHQPEGDVRALKMDKCLDLLEQDLGYRICFNVDLPDLIRSSSLPFGQPVEVRVTTEMTGAPDKGFSITTSTTGEGDHKNMSVVLETPGRAGAKGQYLKQGNLHSTSVSIISSLLEHHVESQLVSDHGKVSLTVHSSRSSDSTSKVPILGFLSLRESSNRSIIIRARTENHLRKLIEVDTEVAIALPSSSYSLIPIAVTIPKWDVIGKICDWELQQKIKSTGDGTDYFKMSLIKAGETYADIAINKQPPDNKIEGRSTVILGNTGMKSLATWHSDDKGVEATWNLLNTRTSDKVIHTLASVTREGKGKFPYQSHLQLHIPCLNSDVDIEGLIKKVGNSNYHVEGRTKYNKQLIYEGKTNFRLSDNDIDVHIQHFLFPEREYKQQIYGAYRHNFAKKKVTSEFFWKNRSSGPQKIKLETNYALEQGAPYTLHGNLDWNGSSHVYNTKVDISHHPRFKGHNEITFAWTTPTGKSFGVRATLYKRALAMKDTLDGVIGLTIYGDEYNVTGKYELERLQGPMEYELTASIGLKSPQIKGKVNATFSKKTSGERKVEITMDIPSSQAEAHVSGVLKTSSFETKIDVKHASEQKILIESNGQIAAEREGLIKSAHLNAEVKLPFQVNKVLQVKLEKSEDGSMHGHIDVDASRLCIKVRKPDPRTFESNNEITFVWTTPKGKPLEVRATLYKRALAMKDTLGGVIGLTIYGDEYNVTGKYELERLQGPMEYELTASIGLEFPQIKGKVNATSKKTSGERKVEITMDIPSSQAEAYVSGVLKSSSFETKIDVKHASEQKILIESNGQIAAEGKGLNRPARLNAEVKLPFQVSKVLQFKLEKREDGSMHTHIDMDAGRLCVKVGKPDPHTLNVTVETPSRTVEAKIALDPSHPSFQLWPNKGKSQDNIEISGQVSQTKRKNKQVVTIDGGVKVSQLRKEILVSAEYSNTASELTGSLEIKAPESSEGLILLTLDGKKDRGLHANVSLSLKQPVRAEIVWTKSTKAIVLHSQRREVAALKYQRIVPEEATLWAKLKTSTIDTEVSSILRAEKTLHCHGLNIHTNYKLHSQKYQTISRLCRPAYIQVVTFKKSQDDNQRKYMSVGMKSPYEIELDLHVERPGKTLLQRYTDVLSIKAEVMTPRIVDLVAHYDLEEVKETKRQLRVVLAELYESWQSIVQELQEHQIYQNLNLLRADQIYQSVRKDLHGILEDLSKDYLIPSADDIYDFITKTYMDNVDVILETSGAYKAKIVESLRGLKKVVPQLKELYEQDRLTPEDVVQVLTSILPWERMKEMIRELKEKYHEEFVRDWEKLKEVFKRLLPWEKMEEMIRELKEKYREEFVYGWEKLKEVFKCLLPWEKTTGDAGSYSGVYQEVYKGIIKTLRTMIAHIHPEVIQKHLEDYNPELYATLRHVVINILDDLKQDAQHLTKSSPLRQVIDWFLHDYKFDDVPQTDALIDFLYRLLVQTPQMIYDLTGRSLLLKVPFIYPENSLSAVPYGAQVSNGLDLLRRIIGIVQRLLPVEYKLLDSVTSSVAVYHGDGFVSTFDGTTMKLPVAQCPYILTTDGYDYVAVKNLQGNKNEFTLTVENGRHKIFIDKDFKVYIDGNSKTENQTHSHSHERIVYESPTEVVVVGTSLQLSVLKHMPMFRLYVSTELQGRLRGVMGTFDDFQGDDMMLANGQITHDPSTFLQSWQVGSKC